MGEPLRRPVTSLPQEQRLAVLAARGGAGRQRRRRPEPEVAREVHAVDRPGDEKDHRDLDEALQHEERVLAVDQHTGEAGFTDAGNALGLEIGMQAHAPALEGCDAVLNVGRCHLPTFFSVSHLRTH